MAIGLNYTHVDVTHTRRILPNYLYLLPTHLRPNEGELSEKQDNEIIGLIEDGDLINLLNDPSSEGKFDNPIVRKILLGSYEYEIKHKFLGKKVANDNNVNDRIIDLFNDFFGVDYEEIVSNYCTKKNTQDIIVRSKEIHKISYSNREEVTKKFLQRVDLLLKKHNFHQESQALHEFMSKKLIVRHEEGISGVTYAKGDHIIVEVGNNTYVTLFHELTHAINRFFRFTYYQDFQVCFDNYTKTSEGFANFVAIHLFDGIISGDGNCIENMPLDELFFSSYIDVYARVRKDGKNDKEYNKKLIRDHMSILEGDLLTPEKSEFYFERFYKFFHYDQNKYLYPKELMYYLGYNTIREMFIESGDKEQLLVQTFLGKVCL